MKLIFYQTNDTANTVNKTLTQLKELEINLTSEQPLMTPTLILTATNVPDNANYAKIRDKYYFVRNTSEFHTCYKIVNFSEDVLMTYAEAILNTDADITSKSTIDYNSTIPTKSTVKTKIIKSDVTLPETETIVVQTNGTTDSVNNETPTQPITQPENEV